MIKLKEEIKKIVEHAVYESGAGNDVLISQDIDELYNLFEKESYEFHTGNTLNVEIDKNGDLKVKK